MAIRLDNRALQTMSLFEATTGVMVKDIYEDEKQIIFIVSEGGLRKLLNRGGEKMEYAKRVFKKYISVVEYSTDIERFVKNMFHRYRPKGIDISREDEGYSIIVHVDPKMKAMAIGSNGKNLKMAREIIQRHFPLKNLHVA